MLLPTGSDLIIASHNKGKISEIRDLLSHFSLNVTSAGDFNLDDPEETETSYEGNALLKARYVATRTGKAALADDSGLSVNMLDGAPGIYSARWAGEPRNFDMAMERVRSELEAKETEDHSASFFCALALVVPEHDIEKVFLGEVKGTLSFPPKGEKGFGYDPIFTAKGMDKTFAEIDPQHKHSISHRADAFRQLVHYLAG